MNKSIDQLKGEIRYAIRLCQRTARLYRHIQVSGTFLAILGGSATMSSLSGTLPAYVSISGGIVLAIAGAALIAIRPADKAALNESDIRRYQAVMVKSSQLTAQELEIAIEEARQGDAPEIELLRDIAYNDVMIEFNRMDCAVPLNPLQKLLTTIA